MENVEFKAELRDIALARTICRAIGASFILTMDQTDTYFRVPSGRLKKRECESEPTEWIYYERADKAAARLSRFTIYSAQQARERFGETSLPVRAVVRKRRELYMLGNTRIHLDAVEGLGTFLELESLIGRDHGTARGHEAVATLRTQFAPALGETVAVGYVDLIDPSAEASCPPPDEVDVF
jgi:predicted adenylyl cyclase CyaB